MTQKNAERHEDITGLFDTRKVIRQIADSILHNPQYLYEFSSRPDTLGKYIKLMSKASKSADNPEEKATFEGAISLIRGHAQETTESQYDSHKNIPERYTYNQQAELE